MYTNPFDYRYSCSAATKAASLKMRTDELVEKFYTDGKGTEPAHMLAHGRRQWSPGRPRVEIDLSHRECLCQNAKIENDVTLLRAFLNENKRDFAREAVIHVMTRKFKEEEVRDETEKLLDEEDEQNNFMYKEMSEILSDLLYYEGGGGYDQHDFDTGTVFDFLTHEALAVVDRCTIKSG